MSNGFPQQPMQQMTMPGYGQPYQQPMMPQMPQPGMDTNMQRYIADMRQKLDDYERRYSQPPQFQMPQQQPMVPQNQPQQHEPAQFVLTPVASMDEAQNHPPDISGKKQWFINKDTDEIYSKQFNVKTAGLEFHRYGIDDAQETAQDGAESTQTEKTKQQDKPDTFKALQAKIEGLEKKQQELEERLNESNGTRANDGTKQSAGAADATDGTGDGERSQSRRGNRSTDAKQPATGK